MPVYVVGHIDVTDRDRFRAYQREALPTITEWGGRVLAGGATSDMLEGDEAPNHNVVIEFATRELALSWYRSDAYQRALPLRLPASITHMLSVLPGLEPPSVRPG